ncbi:hypothetical protein ACFC26_41375 [Kitasatospora purpeofusca]|uniref:hypothetical protein n=1 Tax=Kitasatospora purpeofusca TaxID=67352 RepID=UPI0035D70D8F
MIRSRAELEALRDDARRLLESPGPHYQLAWLDPRYVHDGLSGVLNVVQWLLGERDAAPISGDQREAEELTVRDVGREKIRSEDCVYRRAWTGLTEWYGGGALRTFEWATITHAGGKPRPIPQ